MHFLYYFRAVLDMSAASEGNELQHITVKQRPLSWVNVHKFTSLSFQAVRFLRVTCQHYVKTFP